MPRLFLTNIPYDCEDGELQDWLEAQGLSVDSLRVVRDLVAGVSPAFGYVSVRGPNDHLDAIRLLDWFDKGTLQFPEEFDWWKKAMEEEEA